MRFWILEFGLTCASRSIPSLNSKSKIQLKRVQLLAELRNLIGTELFERDKQSNHLAVIPAEDPFHEIAQEKPVGINTRWDGEIYLRTIRIVASDVALLVHDLNKLEDAVVPAASEFFQLVVDVADGGTAALPEDCEDLEFGIGRTRISRSGHMRSISLFERKQTIRPTESVLFRIRPAPAHEDGGRSHI